MPARKYFDPEQQPVFVLGRLHENDIERLHLLVKAKHPGLEFRTLAQLNDAMLMQFSSDKPWEKDDFSWSSPKAMHNRVGGAGPAPNKPVQPTGFRQHRFQIAREVSKAVLAQAATVAPNQSTFLNSATVWYLARPEVQHALEGYIGRLERAAPGAGRATAARGEPATLQEMIRQAQREVAEAELAAQAKRRDLDTLLARAPAARPRPGFARGRS